MSGGDDESPADGTHPSRSPAGEERQSRREADHDLINRLAADGFAGPRYDRFVTELARYAIAVLRAWMYSGAIFAMTAKHGYLLNPHDKELEKLFFDSDTREELALMTVAVTLPQFRERALIDGGWRADGGAGLTTYFLGACLKTFPNELRTLRRQQRRWQRQDECETSIPARAGDATDDPAVITTGQISVMEALDRTDERARQILALRMERYSLPEIAELLGLSVRAVEAVLYRLRKQRWNRLQGGDRDAP
jgi:RNA polymerase sigma factor (sigma-70 family)